MEAINHSVIFSQHNPEYNEILTKLERAMRTCYKSEDKITPGSAERLIKTFAINHGHESTLEHASLTVKIITDRGITHEIVRHRIASYSQESTRYCNYGNKQIQFVKPVDIEPLTSTYETWKQSCLLSEQAYNRLLKEGCSPQIARSVLPNCLKTEIVMTANIREWRHFLKLRTDKAAHPDMRYVANLILKEFKVKYPILFEDIEVN